MDAANHTADDGVMELSRRGSIEANPAALLMCSPEWCERHPLKKHVEFLKKRCNECTAPKVERGCFQVRTEISIVNLLFLVSIVDDDESVRESLPDLLGVFGLASQTFSSAEEFLVMDGISRSKCLILDVAMPGMRGPDLQKELNRREIKIPIIFITGHRDEALRSRLIEQGAVACLVKPFSDAAMLEALNSALEIK
jgi:CheY-like chemotaxis protein